VVLAAQPPKKDDKLLPDADLQLNRVRGMDADVTYHAESGTAPKLPMKAVSFHLMLVNGDLMINPLSFVLTQMIHASLTAAVAEPSSTRAVLRQVLRPYGSVARGQR
jgi:uncharacterized protein involved in outer membrane biogenesis